MPYFGLGQGLCPRSELPVAIRIAAAAQLEKKERERGVVIFLCFCSNVPLLLL